MLNSFQSFVDYNDKSSSLPPDRMLCVSRKLFPDEIECTACDDINFCFQFQDFIPGKIICTNFCLFFQPLIISSKFSRVPRRFTFIDELFTIPLCSIETIYYTSLQTDLPPTAKELKELVTPLSTLESVTYLKLYLKDFRVAIIDMTRTQHAPNFANQLLCFSKPPTVDHLIQSGANCDWITKLHFNDEESWKQEMKRCNIQGEWRIVNMRRELHRTPSSYPMYVVIPLKLTSHDLNQMAEHYNGGRFPVWLWSAHNGAALLRSSMHNDNWIVKDIFKKLHKYISPEETVHIIKISDANSTPAIRTAFKKLRKLSSIDSHALYNSREKDWFTRVFDTGWTQLVYFCLRTAAEALQFMIERKKSVVIEEVDGVDVSAVISSLVQLCADQESRSIMGMERLINKEWIAMGHPFGQRICGVGKAPTTPTFLLFLDCVFQLNELYPTQFGFSNHFLISLWDLSLTGCVPAFSCSSIIDQLASKKTGGPFPLQRFFTEEYRRLFSNSLNDAAQFLQKTSRSPMKTKFKVESPAPLLCEILRPPTLPVDIVFWDLCYLRWIQRTNTVGAGDIMAEVILDKVMDNLSKKAGLYWKCLHPSTFEPNTLGPSYPYSLPQIKPYIAYNLEDQLDSLSITSNAVKQLKTRERKISLPSNLVTWEPPTVPKIPLRKAPPPPPPQNDSDSVYKTHF